MSGDKHTLMSLTQGFIQILTNANGAEVELSTIERALNTQKRRLYDVINVLAGVGLVERTGKSRVKWVSQEYGNSVSRGDISEREKEIDRLTEKVDADIQDIVSSELFQKFGWIDREDADLCEPDMSVSLYSLRGPPSMSVVPRDTEDGDRSILCRVGDRSEGQIHVHAIRTVT
jgi:transcription factor E2F3